MHFMSQPVLRYNAFHVSAGAGWPTCHHFPPSHFSLILVQSESIRRLLLRLAGSCQGMAGKN